MRIVLVSTVIGLGLLGCTSEGTVIGLNSSDASATDGGNSGGSTGNAGSANNGADASLADDGGAIADAATGMNLDSGSPTTDGSTVNNEGGTACGIGQICFALDSDEIVAPGGGYLLNDPTLGDYVFVKYEMGAIQLSIDIFATEPGEYDASEAREVGKARVYYFDGNGGEFMSSSGTVVITDIGNGTVTGTFSATLEEFDANSQTFTGSGPTLQVENGTFVEVFTPAI